MYSQTPLRGAVLLGGVSHIGAVPVVTFPELAKYLFKGLLATDNVDVAHDALFNIIDMLVHRPEDMPYRRRGCDATAWLTLGENMCDVLVLLFAEEDSGVDKGQAWEIIHETFGTRASKHWIKDAGHSPFLEKPCECRDAILSFADEVILDK
ncbi:hypothetical protein DACRYDRAFT_110163 [Dacryopinax primogenitus]|uniref:AB hydrolase-1 domain-containing protein n=1 Tax=Dacryopinax primogenitus (strain DJM 731) TaxID=1858805 RepID=M5G0T3_DACPD|nr:uncharacterized protein DACRYDRAFT_110163 [Dacryopinax primogenitus]EJT99441.1 hypothetical protein DACRYDRAFT_110163 [Dacryopinax primogenitus]